MTVEGSVSVSRGERPDDLVAGLPPEEVHRRALEARRALGKAQTAVTFWLLEVEKRELYRHFGCSNVFHYAETLLQMAPHTIAEYLRTGKELERLPKLAEAVARGEVAPSKVREISRVATSETEDFWVGVGASSTYRQVERLVAVTPKGGLPAEGSKPQPGGGSLECAVSESGAATIPVEKSAAAGEGAPASGGSAGQGEAACEIVAGRGAPAGPVKYWSKLVVDLENDQMALLDKALDKARKETGARERSELLVHIARTFLVEEGAGKASGSPYRITLYNDPSLKLTWVEGSGGSQFVPPSTLEEAMCDAEILDLTGEADREGEEGSSDPARDEDRGCDPGKSDPARDENRCLSHGKKRDVRRGPRIRRTLPPTLRRKVLERDGCKCTVPGCRNNRHIQIHHIDPLADGGADSAGNLVCLCSRHHRMLHRGELRVERRASGALVWRDGGGRLLPRSG